MTQRTTVTEPEQALDLRATAIAAADKADRQHQSYQAKRRADNAERARTSAAAILRQRLRVATSAAEWTPIGDPDDDRYRSAAAPVDGLSFLAVERYSSDIGYRSTLYLLRPCPAEGCDGNEQAEVSSLEALGWLLRNPDTADGSYSCPSCECRAWKQREADREAAAAAQPDQGAPPSSAEVLAEALRTLIREETAAALTDHQAGWQHPGGA